MEDKTENQEQVQDATLNQGTTPAVQGQEEKPVRKRAGRKKAVKAEGVEVTQEVEEEVPEGKVKANLMEGEFINKGEENNVHFYEVILKDPVDITQARAFKHRKQIPAEFFVKMYQMNYLAQNAMKNVNTAAKIISIAKNITKEHAEEAYAMQIKNATEGRPADVKARFLGRLLKLKKNLHLNGSGTSYIAPEDVIHVPLAAGETLDILNSFPEGVMHTYEDYID